MKLIYLVKSELLQRKHQLLTSLTAVSMGIAAIVGIQTIAYFSKIEVAYQVDALGANIIILPKSVTTENYYAADLNEGETLPESYVDEIFMAKSEDELEGVDNLSPKLSRRIEINGENFTLTGILPKNEFSAKATWSGGVFNTPVACAASRKSILEFDVAEKLRRSPIEKLSDSECVIGAEFAEKLNLFEGGEIKVLGNQFKIVRVLPKTGTVDDSRIFIHLHQAQKILKTGRVLSAIEVIGCCNQIAAGLVDKLNRLLPDAKVVTISQVVATQQSTNRLMESLTIVFLIVIVLVGGASIANYMYANAYERRKEIGTLMALGATRYMIIKMFVIKAILLGLIGGISGGLLGSALAIILGPKIAQIPVFPLADYIGYGVLLSLALCIFASIFPALRAAKTDPCLSIQDL